MKKPNRTLNKLTWLLLCAAVPVAAPSCGGKTGDQRPEGEGTNSTGDGDSSDSGPNTSTTGDGDLTTGGDGDSLASGGDGDGDHTSSGDGDGGASGDGDVDERDRDGDGVLDELGESVDANDDGIPDELDVTGDGMPDGIGVDIDGDGMADGVGIDTDGDGLIDAIDIDGDGLPDDPSPPNPGVKTLGDSCNSPGALACAGENQKLQLLCDGNEWVANGTCSGTEVCDTGEANRGSCQEPIEQCLLREPGHTFCSGVDVRVCGPDRVTSDVVPCSGHCEDGECVAGDACIDLLPPNKDCSGDCETRDLYCLSALDDRCSSLMLPPIPAILSFRAPPADQSCRLIEEEGCQVNVFSVQIEQEGSTRHLALPPGVQAAVYIDDDSELEVEDLCAPVIEESLATGCVELPGSVGSDDAWERVRLHLYLPDGDGPRNFSIEWGTCDD